MRERNLEGERREKVENKTSWDETIVFDRASSSSRDGGSVESRSGPPKRVPRRKTKSCVMTERDPARLMGKTVGTGWKDVSPSAKANLTSHFHFDVFLATCAPPLHAAENVSKKMATHRFSGREFFFFFPIFTSSNNREQ